MGSGQAKTWPGFKFGGRRMAVFTCEKCGNKVETRCKPRKCPVCGEANTMGKAGSPAPPQKGKK
jgi:rubrerythrin